MAEKSPKRRPRERRGALASEVPVTPGLPRRQTDQHRMGAQLDLFSRLQNWSPGLILPMSQLSDFGQEERGAGVPALRKYTPGVGRPIRNTDTQAGPREVRCLSCACRLF